MEEPKIFKNQELYNNLIGIISSNIIKKNSSRDYFLLKKESLDLVKSYLDYNDDLSVNIFGKLMKEKRIKFGKFETQFNRKNRNIYIYYTKTIDDAFAVVHEFAHYINYNKERSGMEIAFNEVIPYTEELRLYEYLKKNISDKEIIGQIRLLLSQVIRENSSVWDNAQSEINLYNNIKKYGTVNVDLLDSKTYKYLFEKRDNYSSPSVDSFGMYMFGIVMSMYINQKISDNSISKKDYMILKNYIGKLSIDEINSLLGLNMSLDESDGLTLPSSDIDALGKTYKLGIKEYNE